MVVASRIDGAVAYGYAKNCQHDQHTCVQHADPVMVVCRRHGVGGYISRETPLVMHTKARVRRY
jgi:hypothetical protein